MTIPRNLGDLANNVNSSGTLGVAGGGTGTTSLAANNVLLGNGTSAPLAVAPGSNGNVLTSNGTTWTSSALPASGAMTLISTVTANNTSQYFTFTNVSGYETYEIIINGMQVSSSGSNPYLEFGIDAGPTWQQSSYNWVLSGSQGGTTFSNNGPNSAGIILGFNGLVSSSSRRYFAKISISGLTGSLTKSVIAQASFFNNGGNWTNCTSMGEWNNSSDNVTAIRIDAASTIVSGRASLYGYSA